jgi:prevent-host-death family protein
VGHPTWSIQKAKDNFSQVVDAASLGEPQTITKHGRPTAVVLSAETYARLRELERAGIPSFKEHLLAMPTKDDSEPFEFDRPEIKLRDIDF